MESGKHELESLGWKVEAYAPALYVEIAGVTRAQAKEILLSEGLKSWLPTEGNERSITGSIVLRKCGGEYQFVRVRRV